MAAHSIILAWRILWTEKPGGLLSLGSHRVGHNWSDLAAAAAAASHKIWYVIFSLFLKIQFSRSVMSDSLRPHEPQHARSPCPSPNPGVHLNPCPSSQWCHPTISSSVVPFSCCLQSFPASGSFPMSQLFAWGGQSIEVSASTSVLPMNTQDWYPLGWTALDLLSVQGTLKSFLQYHSSKASILWRSAFFMVQLTSIHDYWKNHRFD